MKGLPTKFKIEIPDGYSEKIHKKLLDLGFLWSIISQHNGAMNDPSVKFLFLSQYTTYGGKHLRLIDGSNVREFFEKENNFERISLFDLLEVNYE